MLFSGARLLKWNSTDDPRDRTDMIPSRRFLMYDPFPFDPEPIRGLLDDLVDVDAESFELGIVERDELPEALALHLATVFRAP